MNVIIFPINANEDRYGIFKDDGSQVGGESLNEKVNGRVQWLTQAEAQEKCKAKGWPVVDRSSAPLPMICPELGF